MIPLHLADWARKHRISHEAMHDLATLMRTTAEDRQVISAANPQTEAWVQSVVRLEAPERDVMLFRNNVGALRDDRGRVVRYGLANDSAALNKECKSGDLIGWRRVTITPSMVGCVIAQFVSRECKRPGWSYGGDDHERAQLKWAHLVLADGGDAAFATGPGTL